MCGINGIYAGKAIARLDDRLEKMNHSLLHRGPDAGGFFLENARVALGHRRLSIIDTSHQADQPMVSNTGRWVIVFNGEIYNFWEIRKKLNYKFKTGSDTEVILASIEEKGIDWFLQQANGMFAIALYNKANREMFILRDRLGIKPLFFYSNKNLFIFSSEIKGILNSGLVEAIFNENAVDEYLANRYVRSPYTFFEGIYQIEPGCYLKIDSEIKPEIVRYWQLPEDFNTRIDFDEKTILDRFDKALTRAIRYRLVADVPLGTYLSGGVDSSLITAITALNKNEPVNTYTIGFPELNEFSYSEMVANKYQTYHHKILMTIDDYLADWEKLIGFKDAPLGVPNEIPLAKMSQKLKKKITVVLSGEGADELMGGYGRIFRSPFDYQNRKKDTDFYTYFINLYDYVPRTMRDRLISTPKTYRNFFDNKIRDEFLKKSNEENVFRFFHNYHVKGLLQRVDMTTMQTSVEARVPFLDHELIEFSYREIPYDLKLRWNSISDGQKATRIQADSYSEVLDTPKYLLREVSKRYLPEEITKRKKVGFPVPLSEWFSSLENMAREQLQKAGWLKSGTINELVRQSRTEPRAGQILWMFINIEIFRKKYFEKQWKW